MRRSVLLALTLLAGCAGFDDESNCDACPIYGGDRARAGACPDGETCSPSVHGLYFTGVPFSDDAWTTTVHIPTPHVTATGGTQTILISTEPTLYPTEPLAAPYTADATAPIAVVGAGASRVQVRGDGAGSGRLAIRDAAGALDDRLDVTAAPITRVSLQPAGLPDDGRPWRLHTESVAAFVVRLDAGDGTRLADETVAASGSGVARDTEHPWDLIPAVWATAPGDVEIDVAAGGTSTRFPYTIVDHVDRIEALDPALDATGATTIALGTQTWICFAGALGDAHVLGGAMTITATGALTADASPASCLSQLASTRGDAALTVSLDGVSRTFTIHVQ